MSFLINQYIASRIQLSLDQMLCVSLDGQSNAAGKTTGLPSAPVDGSIHGINMRTTGSTFQTLNYPLNVKAVDPTSFGSELTGGYKLWNAYKRPILMDKLAIEGAAVFDDAPNPNFNISSSSTLYPQLRDGILEMKARAALYNKTPVVVLVWIQGERDTTNSTTALAWYTNMTNIYNQLVADGAKPDYIIMNLLNLDQTGAGTLTTRQQVRAGNQQFINDDSTHRFALDMMDYTADLQGDMIHYNNTGQMAMGNDWGDIVLNQIFTGGQQAVSGYSADATIGIQQFNNSVPTAWKTAVATAIDSLVSAGLYTSVECFQIMGMDTPYNSLQDMKGKVPARNVGCTHIPARGFRGNFTDRYVNQRYDYQVDALGSSQSINDNGFGLYIKQNHNTGVAVAIGLTGSGAVRSGLVQASTQLNYYCNSTTGGAYTPEDFFANESFYAVGRSAASGAASIKLYKNGSILNNGNTGSSALPGGSKFSNGNDAGGVLASPADLEALFYIEFRETTMNHATLNTILHQLATDLAAI